MDNKIYEDLKTLLPLLEQIKNHLFWIDAEFRIEYTDIVERSQIKQMQDLNQPINSLIDQINYIFLPIKHEGKLFLNEQGKYQIEGTDYYFSAGEFCEACLPYHYDEGKDTNLTWIPTRIEYGNNGYYFVERPNMRIGGIMVRLRAKGCDCK